MHHLSKLMTFLRGAAEFRSAMTTGYADYDSLLAYDCGREWAHRLTFRRFEN